MIMILQIFIISFQKWKIAEILASKIIKKVSFVLPRFFKVNFGLKTWKHQLISVGDFFSHFANTVNCIPFCRLTHAFMLPTLISIDTLGLDLLTLPVKHHDYFRTLLCTPRGSIGSQTQVNSLYRIIETFSLLELLIFWI